MPAAASRPTGSSTCSSAKSRSTPARAPLGMALAPIFVAGQNVPVVCDGVKLGEIAVDSILPRTRAND